VTIGEAWTKSISNSKSKEIYRVQRIVGDSWVVAEKGWIKLNTDGAVSTHNCFASIGGVLRDHGARWICGFTMKTRQVEMECDNSLVIETILAGGAANSKISELHLIHQLLDCNWRVRLRYILRDHDKVVDHMAKLPSMNCNEMQIL
ncbi:hypothetical protein Gogos_016629, partial [Gossypium gossypioides]|nr:hypothetical protein [Gossypium gossypioides]